MNIFTRLALICAGVALLPLPRSFAQSQSPARSTILSAPDRKVALESARIGVHGLSPALRWLQHQSRFAFARRYGASQTLDIHFRDGGEYALLPRIMPATGSQIQPLLLRPMVTTHDTAPGKALVLEPFADKLGLGADAGQVEISALQTAGFSVDVLRNSDVTIATMETLSKYSVVYMETHSGPLGTGDAVIMTRQVSSNGLDSLRSDSSVLQAIGAGDPQIYWAINSNFVMHHMGTFPNSSLVYFDGCELLGANVLWDAFHQDNVRTMISWDQKVDNTVSEQAAKYVLPRLAQGDSVTASIDEAKAAGLDTSIYIDPATGTSIVAHLGEVGDGTNTLKAALQGVALPTATPMITATSLPTATATATASPIPSPVATFAFDQLLTLRANGQRAHSFRPNESVVVHAKFTLRDITQNTTVTVKRKIQYRRAKVWHTIGAAKVAHVRARSGAQTYRFKFAAQKDHTQRVSVAISVAGQTHTRTAAFTVTH